MENNFAKREGTKKYHQRCTIHCYTLLDNAIHCYTLLTLFILFKLLTVLDKSGKLKVLEDIVKVFFRNIG